jgi:uncharacterized lipoprotein YmbA
MHDKDIVQVVYDDNPAILRDAEEDEWVAKLSDDDRDELSNKLDSVLMLAAQELSGKELEAIRRQHKRALDIIRPSSERRADCEIVVMGYIEEIRAEKFLEKLYHRQLEQAPKKYRLLLKAYRAVEKAAEKTAAVETGLGNAQLLRQITKERGLLEQFFNKEAHGGIKKSLAKKISTTNAWLAIAFYGRRWPTMTEGKDWHQLSAILYGDEDARLFNFHSLRRSGLPTQKTCRLRLDEIEVQITSSSFPPSQPRDELRRCSHCRRLFEPSTFKQWECSYCQSAD